METWDMPIQSAGMRQRNPQTDEEMSLFCDLDAVEPEKKKQN